MTPALLLAAYLCAPLPLVQAVYEAGGVDAVALVSMESQFNPGAVRREPRGHTSYGLFQLDDEWHPQYRDDLLLHIAHGAAFLAECKRGRTFEDAVAVYNGGPKPGAKACAWGRRIRERGDSLNRYLWMKLR